MYAHILIATDGSETADRGVTHGLALARALHSRVTAVTVTEAFPPPGDAGHFHDSQRLFARDVLARVVRQGRREGIAVDGVHVPGARADVAILELADKRGCDLIVMTSHGRTGVNRLLLGSRTSAVLMRAKVPVLVVR